MSKWISGGRIAENWRMYFCTQILTGTGKMTSGFPARSAMWRYSGTPFSAAPALQTARDTPRMAFAPNLAKNKTNNQIHHIKYVLKIYWWFISNGTTDRHRAKIDLIETPWNVIMCCVVLCMLKCLKPNSKKLLNGQVGLLTSTQWVLQLFKTNLKAKSCKQEVKIATSRAICLIQDSFEGCTAIYACVIVHRSQQYD